MIIILKREDLDPLHQKLSFDSLIDKVENNRYNLDYLCLMFKSYITRPLLDEAESVSLYADEYFISIKGDTPFRSRIILAGEEG